MRLCIGILTAFLASGCSLVRLHSLPASPPPLLDMEEPLELRGEPQDEGARLTLPPGSFTGIYVESGAGTLDALAEGSTGVLVSRVIENSPADLAGVLEGDVIVEVRAGPDTLVPKWPSEWRALELRSVPGSKLDLVLDRASVERTFSLTTVVRAHPPGRLVAERFREEAKVGLVVRSATEVEARSANLGPGGGAVIVGLSRASPWRKAGLRFEDLITRVDGVDVAHPQVLIDAIRARKDGEALVLDVVQAGATRAVTAVVGRRAKEVREISIPLIYDYTFDRGRSETSILFGLFKHESTSAAWHTRLFWILNFSGGEADRLAEEKP